VKLLHHFAAQTLANTYVFGQDGPGDCVVVDPGVFDTTLLKLIEDNRYYVRSILLTHSHASHIQGLTTLLRIYQAEVYAARGAVLEHPYKAIDDGEALDLAGLSVDTLVVQGHSRDSALYKVANVLFTGDALSAGRAGSAPNGYSRALLVSRLKSILMGLPDTTILLPGHGPPSTVRAEWAHNADLRQEIAENP
jgi:hydroxyacylglutathione hydrolase